MLYELKLSFSVMNTRRRQTNYADDRFRKLDQRLVHWLESRTILKYVDEQFPEGSILLDMPAGCGRFTGPLLQRGFHVTAGDMKQERLNLIAQKPNKNLRVQCLRGESLPFEDNEFDGAICVRLIQHVRDKEQREHILSELSRVVRKGMVLTAYMESPAHNFIHNSRNQKRLFHYDQTGLQEELEAAGLSIARMTRPIPLHAQTVVAACPA